MFEASIFLNLYFPPALPKVGVAPPLPLCLFNKLFFFSYLNKLLYSFILCMCLIYQFIFILQVYTLQIHHIYSCLYLFKILWAPYPSPIESTGHQLELLSPLIVSLQVFGSQKWTKEFYALGQSFLGYPMGCTQVIVQVVIHR